MLWFINKMNKYYLCMFSSYIPKNDVTCRIEILRLVQTLNTVWIDG